MYMISDEMIDHLFLHNSMTIVLWHRLFSMVKLDWVPRRSISDMMIFSFKGLENKGGAKLFGKLLPSL